MIKNLTTHLQQIKAASTALALLPIETKNQVLLDLAQALREAAPQIVQANEKDLSVMDPNDPKYDRLLLSVERIEGIANDVVSVADLEYVPSQTLEERMLPNGLNLKKILVPLGVVAVIYESRPNVTVDVFSLCFKSGNACVLKGGKEAHHTNQFLVAIIQGVLKAHQLNTQLIYLLPPERAATDFLLKARDYIDLCIPRGSQALIDFVRENAKVPVIETGAGIVHTYFDVSGDVAKGRLIINNAKTRRVSVCNALDTLIIHRERLSDLPELTKLLSESKVEIFADQESYQAIEMHYPANLLKLATPDNFGQEFLSYKMSIKTVASVEEAIAHIQQYSSAHSEAIIAEDQTAIAYFLNHIDAAVVYVNASTAFTDGGQFGMGSEIGVSTQKLHARGPMALEALTSYKWIVRGTGQIRI
jgi:glutamate-5-semialdehyde dehydrogenase